MQQVCADEEGFPLDQILLQQIRSRDRSIFAAQQGLQVLQPHSEPHSVVLLKLRKSSRLIHRSLHCLSLGGAGRRFCG